MFHRRTKPSTHSNSLELRHNPTEAETKLWQVLRMHQLAGVHFRRQHAIGPYVVDFCAPKHHLIIEVDGGQHIDNEEYDQERTAFLKLRGYKVLRFWNNEVLEHIEAVARAIVEELPDKSS